jgi:hypothetical protein
MIMKKFINIKERNTIQVIHKNIKKTIAAHSLPA